MAYTQLILPIELKTGQILRNCLSKKSQLSFG